MASLQARWKGEELEFVIGHSNFGIISSKVGQFQGLTIEMGGWTEMEVNVNWIINIDYQRFFLKCIHSLKPWTNINFFSSESDPSLWTTSSFFLKKKSSGEDEELAGPSHTDTPTLQGMTSSHFISRFLKRLYFRGMHKEISNINAGPELGKTFSNGENMIF